MPLESPLHSRTSAACSSLFWKEWSGFHAVCRYDTILDHEYFALRQGCGMLDVSPLCKYEVEGPDAAELLAWVWARDARKVREGQVVYGCWCDDDGKVLDDGTLTRWAPDRFRMTSAEPAWAWLQERARGFDVDLRDSSDELAAIALQGPTSRAVLARHCAAVMAELRFFRATRAELAGIPLDISRTGYTGDLGYELWVAAERAEELWDVLLETGRDHGLRPVGLDALDVARVEAGFVMGGVDYNHAMHALLDSQKSTPFELGLGWAVHLGRGPFVGCEALEREAREGPERALVGIEVDWAGLEALYDSYGLPPALPAAAWRSPVPVYTGTVQVGRATSGAWSPTLKKSLALATVDAAHARVGTSLDFEVTVEYERRTVPAHVAARPFFDPARKKA